MKKTTICPGCGKIEEKEEIFYLADVLSGETKEIEINKANGLKWCDVCR